MKIFIINLSRSQDRKQAMEQQIAALNTEHFPLDFQFFTAIDAKAGQHEQFAQHYHLSRTKWYRGRELTNGEKACYASHFCLWQKCIALREPIVILEDDITFTAEFISGLQRIKESDYHYVKLLVIKEATKAKRLSEHFYTTWQQTLGTMGYYITPQAATKFVHGVKYWLLPVDNYMDKAWLHEVKTIVHVPPLLQFNTEVFCQTTINGRYARMPFFWKIPREISRFLQQLHMLCYIIRNK